MCVTPLFTLCSFLLPGQYDKVRKARDLSGKERTET